MATASVKLGAIDLNLLVVFDAVMQERSVTRAGHRLGLSQPAMSHALTRLRHALKDDLFIRSPKGMVPTPRSEQLAVPIRAALDALQHSLEPAQFDPATTTRPFRVAVDNYAAVVLVRLIAARLIQAAPKATLEFRPSGTLDVVDLLDRDELDLAIGPLAQQGERFALQPLVQDQFVAVLRKGHPAAAATGELSIETFAALAHLEISSVHHGTDFVDEGLAREKLARRIALRAPFLSAVRILATSDMVAILPERIAGELPRIRPLVLRDLPIPSPTIETSMIWSRRFENQPAHRWLRENIRSVSKDLRSK